MQNNLDQLYDPVKTDSRKFTAVRVKCPECDEGNWLSFDRPVADSTTYDIEITCSKCGIKYVRRDTRRSLHRGWSREPILPNFNPKAPHYVPDHHLPQSLKGRKVW